VVAFRMLPKEIWSIPALGTINLHASLLPDYRGAAPINHAIINGEKTTGVTSFFINEEIDTGAIIYQEKVNIEENDNAGSLHDKLMQTGSELLVKTINDISLKIIKPLPQSQFEKNRILKSAPKISKEDCKINWENNSEAIQNKIRGFSPFPGAFTNVIIKGQNYILKILDAEKQLEKHNEAIGKIFSDQKTYIKISCPDGYISLKSIQLQGKKLMDIKSFLCGHNDILTWKLLN